MGCLYAITCCGTCPSCSNYVREEYVGHAEDYAARQLGYYDYEEQCRAEDEHFAHKMKEDDNSDIN